MGAGRAHLLQPRGPLLRTRPPLLPSLSASAPGEPNDLALRRLFARAVPRPSLCQLPSLLEEVATPIGRFDLVADRVRQCHLANLTREVRLFGAPVGKCRALIEPDDIASTALYLASDESRMVTGQVLPVDSGVTIS